jgi:spore coat protein U-like protein
MKSWFIWTRRPVRWIREWTIIIFLISGGEAWGQVCTVSTVPVQFGQYVSIGSSPVVAVGNVRVACTSGTAFTVKLGPGENSAGGFHPRKLRSTASAETMDYNLYRDSAHVEVWGDGTGSTFVRAAVGVSAEQLFPVYGRIPGGQNIVVGYYRDSLTVTVEW